MSEQEKEKARETFEQMLSAYCCAPHLIACNSCVHKPVCKYAEENRLKCDDYKQEVNYKIHNHIDQLFQPIFKWIQHHYPSGGVYFFVDNNTAKMKIDYGPCVFNDDLKHYAIGGFNSPMPQCKTAEEADTQKEDATDA